LPQVFQNGRVNAVKKFKANGFSLIAGLATKAANLPTELWDSYDEPAQKAGLTKWVAEAGRFAGSDDLPSVDDMSAELERGIWAKWSNGLRQQSYAVFPQTYYLGFGRNVLDRLKALKVAAAANLRGGWLDGENDSRKLYEWGKNYKVNPFTPPSK